MVVIFFRYYLKINKINFFWQIYCIILTAIICRYNLVSEFNRGADELLKTSNRVSYFFGMAGAFGMFIVANFQETAVIQVF